MEKVEKILKKIKNEIGDFSPEIGLISGSGLSASCPDMKIFKIVPYEKVGLQKSIVKGHEDSFIFGEHNGVKMVKFSRFHYYENGDLQKISLPFEIVSKLGVKDIIITTATGGVDKNINAGEIVLIKDHINFAPNPLIAHKDQYFVGLNNAYDRNYRNIVKEISIEEKIDLKEGIHAQLTGPSYETEAEIAMLNSFGVATVSMSTAQDVILSRFYNMNVLCFAVVSNKAGEITSHEEVLIRAKTAASSLKILISKFIENQIKNK